MATEPLSGDTYFADINKELPSTETAVEIGDLSAVDDDVLFNPDFGDEGEDKSLHTQEPELKKEVVTTPGVTQAEKTKRKEEILVALGFKYYDNGAEGRKYTMMLHTSGVDFKLGKTFKLNGKQYWWCFPLDSKSNDKGCMMSSTEIAKLHIVRLYNDILNGAALSPSKTIVGHVNRRHGLSLVIEFESPENYEEKGARFGKGAVKFDVDGKFIPDSFSKETKNQPAKMKVPRTIRLPNFEAEMATVLETEKSQTASEQALPASHVQSADQTEKEKEIAAEMEEHIMRMRLAMRAAVDITTGEVADKIDNQGLAGFVKDVGLALFRESRLAEEKEGGRE